MALLADQSTDAGSHLSAAGLGTSAATFTMPNTVAIKVESVVATVNNAAGGDNIAQLTVSDSAGQVIATRKQAEAIPAGDTGTATFALRLSGASGASSLRHPIGFYNAIPVGGNPVAGAAANPLLNMTFGGAHAGTNLLDTATLGTPSGPVVKTAGMYAIHARIGFDPDPIGPFPANINGQTDIFVQNEPPPEDFFSAQCTQTFPLDNSFVSCQCTVTLVRYLAPNANGPLGAQQFFQIKVSRPAGQALNVTGVVIVQRVY